jgi:hypothetical protein
MTIILQPIISQETPGTAPQVSSLLTVQAGLPVIEGCPVLTRTKVFVIQQGTTPTLEHVFRNRNGEPIDLIGYTDASASASTSASDSQSPEVSTIVMRCKELIAPVESTNPVKEVEAVVVDSEAGVVHVALEDDTAPLPGVYQLSFGIMNTAGRAIATDSALLIVEKSLFSRLDINQEFNFGPPRLEDIRMTLIDHVGDNLLWETVEFSDEQLAHAIARPVRMWNEQPPPLRPAVDTRNFPFTENWRNGIVGHLLQTAAHSYRRNVLNTRAGGMDVSDKAKEKEYLQASLMYLNDYKTWLTAKKLEINCSLFAGTVGSIYGRMFY